MTRALWIVAALLACVVSVLFATTPDRGEGSPTPVLVVKQLIPTGTPAGVKLIAKQLIPAGTPGRQVVDRQMYSYATADAVAGELTTPTDLIGRVAIHDVFPGQPLSDSDFSKP